MPFIGELSALLTACLWSGSAMMFASATRTAGSFQVNITRLILAVFYLGSFIAAMGFDLNLSRGQVFNLCISGIIGITLGDTFLFIAFRELGARISMLIMSLAPAIAAIIAYYALNETLSTTSVTGIAITIFGIGIVVFDRGAVRAEKLSITTSGVLYALLGAVGQGAGLIFAKLAFLESEVNGFVASEIRIMASLVFLFPVAVVTGRFKHPLRMFREERKAFWFTAAGSVLGPFLGISFSLIAVGYTTVGVAATLMGIVPILMLPLVRFIYKEKLKWRAILGAFVAVTGVAVLFFR